MYIVHRSILKQKGWIKHLFKTLVMQNSCRYFFTRIMYTILIYSPHSVDFTFSTLTPRTNYNLRGQSREQQANGRVDRPLSPPQNRQQGEVTVIRDGKLSYGCIYKTHLLPIMLVSISMCFFSMILKYRTLYSKSKMSLNWEKLFTNHVNMSTILFIM